MDQVAQPEVAAGVDFHSTCVEGDLHPTIASYFETLNQGDYAATAALFAPAGSLYPPLEAPVVGTEAIATYLATEAPGLKLVPGKSMIVSTDTTTSSLADSEISDMTEYKVTGLVETPLFRVNVAWCFKLTAQSRLQSVGIKLLATLEELLHFRPENT